MTPIKKELDHTILRVDRSLVEASNGSDDGSTSDRHVAGGQHTGIIINKQVAANGSGPSNGMLTERGECNLKLAFKVFLVNAITQIHQQELRELRFWFANAVDSYYSVNLQCAQSFFRALVNGGDFPKNYVGFIMKLMKTMQQPVYRPIVQLELEVRSIDEPFEPPSSTSKYSSQSLPDIVPKVATQHHQAKRPLGPRPPVPPKPAHLLRNRKQVQSSPKSLGSFVDLSGLIWLVFLRFAKAAKVYLLVVFSGPCQWCFNVDTQDCDLNLDSILLFPLR